MNKIFVDTVEYKVENVESTLEVLSEHLHLICQGNNKVFLEASNNLKLDITLLDQSTLDFSFFSKHEKENNEITIEQFNNTNIKYRESFSSTKDCNLVINNIIKGNNNKSNIKIRCISYDKKISIEILANVLKETKNNDIIEDIKGINHGGIIETKPNMQIATSEVVANHFVSIGKIEPTDLFYLESKGISKEQAEKLILDGFLKSINND